MNPRPQAGSCNRAWINESGAWVVGHDESSPYCTHGASGGHGGHTDGQTRCNRIIAKGRTKSEALDAAMDFLGEVDGE